MEHKRPLRAIADDELLRLLAELMRQSRRVESELVAHIREVDERRLYAREASPSMFAYCTEVLHPSPFGGRGLSPHRGRREPRESTPCSWPCWTTVAFT